jgi:hypothetical protein
MIYPRWEIWYHSIPNLPGKNIAATFNELSTAETVFPYYAGYYDPELWSVDIVDGQLVTTKLLPLPN